MSVPAAARWPQSLYMPSTINLANNNGYAKLDEGEGKVSYQGTASSSSSASYEVSFFANGSYRTSRWASSQRTDTVYWDNTVYHAYIEVFLTDNGAGTNVWDRYYRTYN